MLKRREGLAGEVDIIWERINGDSRGSWLFLFIVMSAFLTIFMVDSVDKRVKVLERKAGIVAPSEVPK